MWSSHQSKRVISGILGAAMVAIALQATAFAKDSDDDTPPVLHSVAVSQTMVHPGESIVVSADADDDDSGVRSITVRFQNIGSGRVLVVDLLLNSDEDISLPYSGLLKIPKETEAGTYQVVGVTLKDWEENQSRYAQNGQEPLEGKMLASFTVANIDGGGTSTPVSCQAQANDTGVVIQLSVSGAIPDEVTLLFENSENHHKLTFTLDQENYRDGIFAGEFDISPYEPSGTFSLKKVTVKDVAGNKTTYTTRDDEDKLPLQITASFAVQTAHADLQAPVLHSVEIGQPVWNGDEAKALLTVEASDNQSGIEHITVKFKHVATGDKASKILRDSDSKDGQRFTGYLTLDDEDVPGAYQLDSVTVVDRSGNRSTYCHPDDVNDRKLPLPQLPTFQFQ